MIECGAGVFVACLPTLRPLLGRLSFSSVVSGFRTVFSPQSLWSRATPDKTSVRLSSMERSDASQLALATCKDHTNTWAVQSGKRADLEDQISVPDREIVVETEIMQSARRSKS